MSARNILQKSGKFMYPSSESSSEELGRFDMSGDDPFFGRMNDPTAAGFVKR